MLWAQLPVFGLFQLSIGEMFMLLSYGPILSCSCAVGGLFLDPTCLLPVMHKSSLNEGFFPNCGGRTAENCGRDDFLESTYSAAKFDQCFVCLNPSTENKSVNVLIQRRHEKLNRTDD